MKSASAAAAGMAIWMAVLIASSATAQEGVRPGDDRLPEPPLIDPSDRRPLELPPPPSPSSEERDTLSAGAIGFVSRIRVEGSTLFSDADLATAVAPYEGRLVGSVELHAARDAVTALYREAGYITSGAILPDQSVEGGEVRIEVIEGKIATIDLQGLERFRAGFFRSRLARASRQPVSVWQLEAALQRLQQDPLIERVNAQLLPTSVRGESQLLLEVVEAPMLDLELGASNHRSPSIGEFVGESHGRAKNLAGYGDALDADFDVGEGLIDYEFRYSIPINRFDTRLSLSYRESLGEVVLNEFDSLDIESELRTWGIGLAQPLIRDYGRELEIGLVGEVRESETTLSDRNFCTIAGEANVAPGTAGFIVDAPDCQPRVAAIRTYQEYIQSGRRSAIALRSTLSVGVDAFSATKNKSSVADGRFVSWIGQLQAVHRLPVSLLQTEVIGRIDMQLASDPLLSLEKFSIGGARTVRGYRENQLVRDNGIAASIELRVPLIPRTDREAQLALIPFVDVGHGWDESGPGRLETDTVASVGMGLAMRFFDSFQGQIFYGGRLTGAPGANGTGIQRHGVHFRVTVEPLRAWRRQRSR